jgi:hypothetical protein
MDLTITVISSGNRQSISAAKASRVFAYDQWGFWAGREAYAADLQSFVQGCARSMALFWLHCRSGRRISQASLLWMLSRTVPWLTISG